jgi:hypothetical protein
MRRDARFAAVVIGSAGILCAQEFRAKLQGTVTDPAGGVIPHASLTIRSPHTGFERRQFTDGNGYYLFSFLPPGGYVLTVSAPGFKIVVENNVVLGVSTAMRLNVELPISVAVESITVSAELSLVRPESGSLGSTVHEHLIGSLPLKGHSSLVLFNFSPGVISERYGEDTRPVNTVQNVLYSSSGAPPATGDVSVDGVSNTVNVNRGANIAAWVPAMDAVAEFKLQTGILPAEYGRSAASIMNIVIKSGSSSVHGDVYNYSRNAALDANLFFPRGAGEDLTPYSVHTFGVNLGGPVKLPGVQYGRDRTFFFFNYEGMREGNGSSFTGDVPTPRMRQGDFSEQSKPIYNPLSLHTSNGAPLRDPFPGNVVPASLQDPVGRNIAGYYPLPNVAAPDRSQPWLQDFVFSSKWPRNYDAVIVKLDHHSPRHQAFVRMNKGDCLVTYPKQFDGIATAGGGVVHRPHFGLALNDTVSVASHTIVDLRLGYAGGSEKDRPTSDGFDPARLGLPAAYSRMAQSYAFPAVTVNTFMGMGGSPYIEQLGYTWSLQTSVSHQRGQHLWKTGLDGRLTRGNFLKNTAPSGRFQFDMAWTRGPRADTPSTASGSSIADMLLGYGWGSIDTNAAVSIQNPYLGLYLQDDYRLTRRLTLNLGLRFDLDLPRTERYDRTTRGFAYNTPSPLSVPGLDLRGGLLYAGVGGRPRGLRNPDWNNFAPRLSIAYSLSPRTVIRAGGAVNYVPAVGSVEPTGYSVTTPWVSSIGGYIPNHRLSNPFPNGPLPATENSLGLATLVGEEVSFVDPGDRVPIFLNWQFAVQREFHPRTLLEVAYVGSRGVRILGGPIDYATVVYEQLNQLSPSYLNLKAALLEPVQNPFYGIIADGPLAERVVQRQQLLRPYPQFTSVVRNNPAFGNSSYHSLQVRLEKRAGNGLSALVSYTLSKNINDVAVAQDAYNRGAERALSEFDAPQRLTVTAAWDLPFGKGQRWFKDASGAAALVGGWQLATFSTFQSGFPLAFKLSRTNLFMAGATQRPSAAGDPSAGIAGGITSRLARYFNTAAFAQPADFTFGNLGPRVGWVRSPGMNNVNLRLGREFRVKEKLVLSLRASSFNLFNHPVFSAPNTTVGSSNFGRVFNQANLSRQTELAAKVSF